MTAAREALMRGRPVVVLAAARGASQVGVLVAGLAVARSLGPTTFGIYAFLSAVSAFTVVGFTTGLGVYGLREVSRGAPSHEPDVVRAFLAVAAGGAVVALAISCARLGTAGVRLGLLSIAAFVPVGLAGLRSSLLCGRERFDIAARVEAAVGLGAGAVTIALAAVGALTIERALLALGAGGCVGVAFAGRPKTGSRTPPLRLVTRSVPFVLMGVASAGYARLDIIGLAAVRPGAQVGLYGAAYRVLGPVTTIGSAFGTVFFARISKVSDPAQRREAIRRARRALVAVVAVVVAAGIAAAGYAFRVVLGPAFAGAVFPARVLLLSALPFAWYWPVAHALNAADREWQWSRLLAAAAVTSLATSAALGRLWGATGAATAWLLTECTLMVVLIFVERRTFGRPIA